MRKLSESVGKDAGKTEVVEKRSLSDSHTTPPVRTDPNSESVPNQLKFLGSKDSLFSVQNMSPYLCTC